jgi:hypothetical protein
MVSTFKERFIIATFTVIVVEEASLSIPNFIWEKRKGSLSFSNFCDIGNIAGELLREKCAKTLILPHKKKPQQKIFVRAFFSIS